MPGLWEQPLAHFSIDINFCHTLLFAFCVPKIFGGGPGCETIPPPSSSKLSTEHAWTAEKWLDIPACTFIAGKVSPRTWHFTLLLQLVAAHYTLQITGVPFLLLLPLSVPLGNNDRAQHPLPSWARVRVAVEVGKGRALGVATPLCFYWRGVATPDLAYRYLLTDMGGGSSKAAQLQQLGHLFSDQERQCLNRTFHIIAGYEEATFFSKDELQVSPHFLGRPYP
jgi:hypothetical protein